MRRRVLSYSLLALAATAAAGGYAAHRLLDRPGESALAMVPANASALVALDLVPAPDQVLAFKSIDEMISKAPGEPPKGALIGTLLYEAVHEEALRPIGEQIDRSIALAMLPKPGKPPEDGEGVALMPVKNPQTVAAYLSAKGKVQMVDGMPLVAIATKGHSETYFSLQGSTLLAATTAWPVAAAAKVAMGKAPSIVNEPAYLSARARALPAANLMVFLNPKLARSSDWLVSSMTIRDTGLELAVSGQTDDPDISKAGSLTPLGSDVLDSLPRGAYGFVAVAQPGPAVALAGSALDEPAKGIKQNMEMDLRSDVLPALGGNVAVAFYPSFGMDAGLDLLVSVDDANGADPASLARKLEKSLGDQLDKDEKNLKGSWKVTENTPAGETSRLGSEPTGEMQKALRDMEKSFFRPLTLSRWKTVAWATVGNSVLLATSQDLLNKAVYARRNPSAATGLSGDTAFGANPSMQADGQFAFAFSMKKLAEGVRNTVDPSHMGAETAKMYRKALAVYDATTEPLAVRAKMEPNGRFQGHVSIPLDWTKLPEFMK